MLGEVNRRLTAAITLVSGRDPAAVVDLPRDLVAAADLLSHADERVAVLVGGALPAPAAGRRLHTVADEFFARGPRMGM